MRCAAGAVCCLVLLGSGCGAPPVATVDRPPGPVVSCAGVAPSFPLGLLAGVPTDLAAGDPADRTLLAALQEGETFGGGGGPLPVTDWFRVAARDGSAAWVRSADRRTVVAAVEFVREGGAWRYRRSAPAGCALRLDEPGVEIPPVRSAAVSGSAVELYADSGSCTGDRPALEGVQVDETDRAVTVVVRLRPAPLPPGTTACGGVGFTVPVRVALERPLGGRALVDGSSYPAVEVVVHPPR